MPPPRRVVLADTGTIAAYTDPLVAELQSWDDFTIADAETLCRGQERTAFGARGSWAQLAITLKTEGMLVGDCGVRFCEGDPERLEVGITLARPHQSRGLATEALAPASPEPIDESRSIIHRRAPRAHPRRAGDSMWP